MKNINRPRILFERLLLLAIVITIFSCKQEGERNENVAQTQSSEYSPWKIADSIVKNMRVPDFPEQTFNVLDHGAVADSITDNTEAFAKAIKACNEGGGGHQTFVRWWKQNGGNEYGTSPNFCSRAMGWYGIVTGDALNNI